jgi:superfamily II DNA or RNA helicase
MTNSDSKDPTELLDAPQELRVGMQVRLRGDPSRSGELRDIAYRSGRWICKVRFATKFNDIPCTQLEPLPAVPEEPFELLLQQRFSTPEVLRRVLAHIRLNGRLADIIYSMEATNTTFFAYQFKPVLKMLEAPTGGLLIADEVGLGKTIEAGLVWTELRARFEFSRLLVVCPRVLCNKWRDELTQKFGLDARVLDAGELQSHLAEERNAQRGFVAVCSLQGLQPPRGWDDEKSGVFNRASSCLARFLEEHAEDEPLIDLLVVDESHHLRNPETQRHRLGLKLRPVSSHRLFLSATPINLRSRDLFAQLTMLDPDTFRDQSALKEIVEANRPLVQAREQLLKGTSTTTILGLIDAAVAHPHLAGDQRLTALRHEITSLPEHPSIAERTRIAARLESVNLLANIVNRTRRRDVQEFRVIRDPKVWMAEMRDEEREIFASVREEVRCYALEHETVPTFLLATAERMLSSCIPATLAHWRAQNLDPESEDEDEQFDSNDNGNGRWQDEVRPLIARLARLSAKLPPPEMMEAIDTKFDHFYRAIRKHISDNKSEKVVVFSTYRPTLQYLQRRLSASGLPCALIHGAISDRDEVLASFADNPEVCVLLSSEIGSEGIDLQFCRAVINYDLPWNPMRVEQRIGRIDRLGQTAEKISVISLLHKDTIDERIYTRLYARLDLIRSTLGDFEDVLGEKIRELTADLLKRELTAAQQTERIEQVQQAIENVGLQTRTLEEDAGSLIAHGDSILTAINAAKQNARFISARDLAHYIGDSLAELYPGCVIRELQEPGVYSIQLTQAARDDFGTWIAQRGSPSGGRLQRDLGAVICQLGRPATGPRRRGSEAIIQSHPFVRFVASTLEEKQAQRLRPAIAVRLPVASESLSIAAGCYAILACLWLFEGQVTQERLAYAGVRLLDGALIGDDDAERLFLAAAEHGRLWPDVSLAVNEYKLAANVLEALVDRLHSRFASNEAEIQAKQLSRVNIQLRTLDAGFERNRDSLKEQIRNLREQGRSESIIRATEGRLSKLGERHRQRRRRIEEGRNINATSEQFAAALVEVS